MNMIGATSPAPRLTARMAPVRMPAVACGSTTCQIVCQRVAPSASAASRVLARHGAQRLLGGDDHDRQGQQRERERRPQIAPAGRNAARRRAARSMPRADELDEEAEAEEAEHDRRHAGEVADRDAHQPARSASRAARTRAGRSR